VTSRDGATMTAAMRMAVLGIAITGCGQNLDSVVWDCQLAVQKENAGKSAAAADQRNHDIEACMRGKGISTGRRQSFVPDGNDQLDLLPGHVADARQPLSRSS
jgi:hypothetical protein